jgi:hypothetical protein
MDWIAIIICILLRSARYQSYLVDSTAYGTNYQWLFNYEIRKERNRFIIQTKGIYLLWGLIMRRIETRHCATTIAFVNVRLERVTQSLWEKELFLSVIFIFKKEKDDVLLRVVVFSIAALIYHIRVQFISLLRYLEEDEKKEMRTYKGRRLEVHSPRDH